MQPLFSRMFQTTVQQALIASQEGISKDGVEREFVFYGKMVDHQDLQCAKRAERQEQYQLTVANPKDASNIRIRIRKSNQLNVADGTLIADRPSIYTLTIKSYSKGVTGALEIEHKLSEEPGEELLALFKANGEGMCKDRYCFNMRSGYLMDTSELVKTSDKYPKGMIWEVDVSTKSSELWVKIDLEVEDNSFGLDDIGASKVDEEKEGVDRILFPIRLTDVIYHQPLLHKKNHEAIVKRILKDSFSP